MAGVHHANHDCFGSGPGCVVRYAHVHVRYHHRTDFLRTVPGIREARHHEYGATGNASESGILPCGRSAHHGQVGTDVRHNRCGIDRIGFGVAVQYRYPDVYVWTEAVRTIPRLDVLGWRRSGYTVVGGGRGSNKQVFHLRSVGRTRVHVLPALDDFAVAELLVIHVMAVRRGDTGSGEPGHIRGL